jgi:hypothetical protein
VTTSVIILEP